jgi:enterochelin esterase-like enzyme
MQLTNPILPWLIAIIAAVVFVMLVVGWPRWRHRVARAATRGIEGLLVTALVLIVCFLLVNNTYVLFTTWSDLGGSSGAHTTIKRGATQSKTGTAKIQGSSLAHVTGSRSYTLPDPKRRMQKYTVRDAASKASMQVLVHLPAGYRPTSSKKYPVIVGLHGFPSVPESFTKINFISTADHLAARGKLAHSIFVIPQINKPHTRDTECVNGPSGDPQTETWLSKELPHWIVRHFHVRTDRESWATLGYSFGGWCAAFLTMRHPGLFGAGISFAGYFKPEFGKKYHPLTAGQQRKYNLIKMARTSPPPVAIWAFASKQDHEAYPTTRKFLHAVRPPMTATGIIVPTGGHIHFVYEPYTATALKWLAKTLPGFRP